jgi:hypothetical protein
MIDDAILCGFQEPLLALRNLLEAMQLWVAAEPPLRRLRRRERQNHTPTSTSVPITKSCTTLWRK